MYKNTIPTRRGQKGFTLIELLVVVLIIGILAAVAVPQYFKVVEKGRFAEANNCFGAIKGSMERYSIKKGDYAGALYPLTGPRNLDVVCAEAVVGTNSMKHFGTPTLATAAGGYTISVPRNGTGTSSYGSYTAILTMPAGTFTCTQGSVGNCTDLLP